MTLGALQQSVIQRSRHLAWEDARDALEYVSIGSVVGTHAGPGAIAVAFFRKGCPLALSGGA